jgi:hypothetical protein
MLAAVMALYNVAGPISPLLCGRRYSANFDDLPVGGYRLYRPALESSYRNGHLHLGDGKALG